MLFRDAPDHTRVRKALHSEFQRQGTRAKPVMEGIVSRLVDELLEKERFNLTTDFTWKIPGLALTTVYQLPESDAAMITGWWTQIKVMQRVFLGAPADVGAAGTPPANCFNAMTAYLDDMLRERRRSSGDDLLSEMIRAEGGGGRYGARLTPE